MTVQFVTAREFATTHRCSSDWVHAMGDKLVPILKRGQQGTKSGYEATVIRHYQNGMYEVRVPGGEVCIDYGDFKLPQSDIPATPASEL